MYRHLRLRLFVTAILTFSVGVAIVAGWLAYHQWIGQSTLPPCFPPPNSNLPNSGKVGAVYFPSFSFAADSELDSTRAKLPSSILAAMNEPSYLSFTNCAGSSYRFLLIHTNRAPVLIRAWKTGNEHYLLTKELDGAGGSKFGNHLVQKTRPVSEHDWVYIVNAFDSASFWDIPKIDPTLSTRESTDSVGSLWIIEGFDNQRYNVVSRWSPQDDSHRKMGLILLDLGNMKVDRKYLN